MLDWIADQVMLGIAGALMPAYDFLLDGTSRYFWLYCFTGLCLAAYAYSKHKEAMSFEATLFDKNVWLSASAINDYIIFVLTPVLRLTVLSGLAINWKAVSAFVVSALQSLGVSGSATDGTALALGSVLTIALFLTDDFLRWYVHYTFHRIPELWEFHKVHHSAEVLNFATAERHHPVETIMTGAVLGLGMGVVNGLFIGVFGDKLTVTTVAGANVFLFAFNIFGGVLRHSPFWVSFGPSVEKWLISPAMHQIHHSNKQEHFDRNFGGALAVWDRMAGSLHIPKGREIEGYGIGPETPDFRSMEVILLRPFISAWRVFRGRSGASGQPKPIDARAPSNVSA